MEILYTNIIVEATFAPFLTVVYLQNGLFYIHHEKIGREFIPEITNMDKSKSDSFILSCLENKHNVNNNIIGSEELLIKYPSLSPIILPYLRDKKIDKLI